MYAKYADGVIFEFERNLIEAATPTIRSCEKPWTAVISPWVWPSSGGCRLYTISDRLGAMLMRFRHYLILTLLVLSCVSCFGSEDLSRELAAQLIRPQVDGRIDKGTIRLTYVISCGVREEQKSPGSIDQILRDELKKNDGVLSSLLNAGVIVPGAPEFIFQKNYHGSFCLQSTYIPGSANLFFGVVQFNVAPDGKQNVLRELSQTDHVQRENPDGSRRLDYAPYTRRSAEVVIARTNFVDVTGIRSDSRSAVAEYRTKREVTSFGAAVGQRSEMRTSAAAFAKYDDGWRLAGLQ